MSLQSARIRLSLLTVKLCPALLIDQESNGYSLCIAHKKSTRCMVVTGIVCMWQSQVENRFYCHFRQIMYFKVLPAVSYSRFGASVLE